jgi:O-antigen/teichoic acid export membrane protein
MLLPILTRRLTPADYGIVSMFQIMVSVIYPFIGMNLEGAIGRKFFDRDGSDFSSYIGTCFILVMCSVVIITILILLFLKSLNDITLIPGNWILFTIVMAICQFITAVIFINFQIHVLPLKYGILQIAQTITNLFLSILFVLELKKTWDGRIEAQLITAIVFALISIIILISTKQINFKIKKKYILHALNFGVPLIPHALGGMLFIAIDRFFLTRYAGLDQTGNYTVAYQLGSIINITTFSFNNAFSPWLFENLNKNDFGIKKKIVKFTYVYFILLIIGAVLLILIFPFIISIFVGVSFTSITSYSTFIIFGFVFQGMYFMVTNYISYAQKTFIQALVTISIGLLKIPIAYFSITFLGSQGASFSFFLTFLIFFIATWILSSKVYPMPWTLERLNSIRIVDEN